jgi:uncharacterized protein (UPF0332 family)
MNFKKCLEQKRIVKIIPTKEMIDKELASAKYDLKMADESLMKNDSKWASVQAYYSMFHSAKALVLNKGYREKSHYCLIVALRELYIKTEELDKEIGDDLENCMDIRHEADYGLTYDTESATICIDAARNLLESADNILKKENEK